MSIVIPARDSERTLPYTLAALSVQDYPAHLLEVVVADDGSDPPLRLPSVYPERTRVTRVPGPEWGRAAACHAGVLASEGAVVFFLDSDMVPFPSHVSAQLRWHHLLTDAVTMGHKRFVPQWGHVTVQAAIAAAGAGSLDELFQDVPTQPHWVEEVAQETDGLNLADHSAFRVFVGATGALRRELYDAAGGMDVSLRLGEDTELGYRLAQRGAVFIPVDDSRSWHLGPPTVLVAGDASRRWNRPFLANRMPYPRVLRRTPGRTWQVPLVRAVVTAPDRDYEATVACVDRLLGSAEQDLAVDLVGDWDVLTDERRPVLTDAHSDLHLLREWYRAEPRVRLVTSAPDDVFPSPFRLDLAVAAGVGSRTVGQLLTTANKARLGLLHVTLPGGGPEPALTLTRTAAWARARRHLGAAGDDELAAVWGRRVLDGTDLGLVDLRAPRATGGGPGGRGRTGERGRRPRRREAPDAATSAWYQRPFARRGRHDGR